MANTKYTQCKLRKNMSNSSIDTVSYIPSKHAQVGNKLKTKGDGFWDKGWVVVEVYKNSEREEIDLPDSHRGIKGHRRSTGDSTKREKK